MQRLAEAFVQSLIRAVIVLALLVMGLITILLLAEFQQTVDASIITEHTSSVGPPLGWHPPLRL